MKIIGQFVTKYRVHIIAWLSFIIYETVVLGLLSGKFGKFGSYTIHYILNILLFYFHSHIVLKYALRSRPVVLALPFGIALEIILYTFIYYLVDNIAAYFPEIFGIEPIAVSSSVTLKIVWRSLYFIGFSTGYYFLITLLKEKERTASLEKQQLHQIIEQQKMEQELGKAQNAYLRAQINPHFLFNTLNFIYNKTRKAAPVAADAILTLSAMMRYAVESNEEKGYIMIEEEIEQVHNLIHLHSLRQNDQIYFHVEVEERVRNISIIPLILITLVENIFKHGNLSLVNHRGLLKVYIYNEKLFIETDNLVNEIHNASGLSKGLENVAKRLQHSYGDQANFSYAKTAKNHFSTKVEINLAALGSSGGTSLHYSKVDKQ